MHIAAVEECKHMVAKFPSRKKTQGFRDRLLVPAQENQQPRNFDGHLGIEIWIDLHERAESRKRIIELADRSQLDAEILPYDSVYRVSHQRAPLMKDSGVKVAGFD